MRKKIIAVVLMCALVCMIFVGCAGTPVKKVVKSKDFTPAYSAIETNMEYRFDALHLEYRYVPITESVHHDDAYTLTLLCTYEDGTNFTDTISVSKEVYEKYSVDDEYTE